MKIEHLQREKRKKMMHHMAAKNNLVDSASDTETGLPLCPKPRRLGRTIPRFLTPLRCSHHIHSQSIIDERTGVFNIMGENMQGMEWPCSRCYPSCYSGSPPGRTENPLVHDVYFVHQMELVSPLARSQLSDKFSLPSASPT